MAVKTSLSRQEFLKSDLANILRTQLESMVDDPKYNTQYRYVDGPAFITKQMLYMSNHRDMNHEQYVQNLKLMLKAR